MNNGKPDCTAIIYRHSDGYPEAAGCDIIDFLLRCKKFKDSRLEDHSFLAARYVVFLGELFAYDYKEVKGEYKKIKSKDRLNFISVGVMPVDPGNIAYRYTVDSGKILDSGLPEVKCYKVFINDDGTDRFCEEVPIPHTALGYVAPTEKQETGA